MADQYLLARQKVPLLFTPHSLVGSCGSAPWSAKKNANRKTSQLRLANWQPCAFPVQEFHVPKAPSSRSLASTSRCSRYRTMNPLHFLVALSEEVIIEVADAPRLVDGADINR